MTITVPQLDVNQSIVLITEKMQAEMEKSGAPSPYFEELWFTLIALLEEIDARLVAGGL